MQRQAKASAKQQPKTKAQKTQKVQKVQKRTKVTKVAKVAKKRVTKASAPVARSAMPSFTAPSFAAIKPVSFASLSAPKSVLSTTTRSFRSSARLFNEPAATGPAAVDDVSPKVQKIVDDILSLNIMESLQLTKSLKAKFGYSDAAFAMAAPAAAAPGAGAAAAAVEEEKPKKVEKTAFNVKLESFDAASKVKIIKEVRTITGLGLKEAKDLVDGAPQILKKEVKKEEAEALIKLMKEIGAVCIME